MTFRLHQIRSIKLRMLLTLLLVFIVGESMAQVNGCTVTTMPLSFGSYDVSAITSVVTSSRIDVRCAMRTTLTLGIDGGNNPGGQWGSRSLRHISSGDTLAYNVYHDASLSLPWGSGYTSPGRMLTVSGMQSVFVYAVLPAGQDVRFGEYRDALSIVVMP